MKEREIDWFMLFNQVHPKSGSNAPKTKWFTECGGIINRAITNEREQNE